MAKIYGSQKIQELTTGQKIQVRQHSSAKNPKTKQTNSSSIIIEAPLPESFGFSSGSQFGSPFASYSSSGLIAQLGALTGFSNQYGLFTQKFYEGPQDSQVSFEMKFDTWEDSATDVILPVMYLMIFSTGSKRNKLSEAQNVLAKAAQYVPLTIANFANEAFGLTKTAGDKLNSTDFKDIFYMLHTPPEMSIRFGDAYTLSGMFLSNVSLQFSNVLDHNYLPMSCTASVTADFKNPLTQGDVKTTFHH